MIDIEGLRGAIAALCVRERRALTAGRPPIGDPPPDDDEDDDEDEEDEDAA